jgi:HAD superfamily hydrolase (TIGR01509 family)
MIKALVFDMDGVIIDSEPMHTEISVEVLKELGGTPSPSELFEFVGVRNEEMWAILKQRHNLKESVEEILKLHENHKRKRFSEEPLKPIEGIPQLIQEAKNKDLKLALATSSPKFLAELVLKRLDLYSFFDIIVAASDISQGKPHPEIYFKAARKLGVEPEECIAIEDSYYGMMSAKNAGMKCIVYDNPNAGNYDKSQADYVVSSIKNIDLDAFIR